MRKDKKTEYSKEKSTDDKERLKAHIPLSQWDDIERKMAIVSRMSTEPIRTPSESVSS
ncbi:MAG: hypothetical protein AM324_006060 [Candidatus Thorarchaeota archaeon SMTZ1-83]